MSTSHRQISFESPVIDPKWLGEELATLRRTSGVTQEQVAEAVGADQAAISRIEKGAQGVSVDRLQRMLSLYGYQLVVRPLT